VLSSVRQHHVTVPELVQGLTIGLEEVWPYLQLQDTQTHVTNSRPTGDSAAVMDYLYLAPKARPRIAAALISEYLLFCRDLGQSSPLLLEAAGLLSKALCERGDALTVPPERAAELLDAMMHLRLRHLVLGSLLLKRVSHALHDRRAEDDVREQGEGWRGQGKASGSHLERAGDGVGEGHRQQHANALPEDDEDHSDDNDSNEKGSEKTLSIGPEALAQAAAAQRWLGIEVPGWDARVVECALRLAQGKYESKADLQKVVPAASLSVKQL
jgi:hypothetical protein